MVARTPTAVVLASLTLLAGGCGGDDESATPPTATTASTTETTRTNHTTTASETTTETTETTTTTPSVRTLSIVVERGRPTGGIKTFTVKKGERVAIVVHTDAGESIHLHGYWLEKPVVAGKPTRIVFTATTPGRFDVELHEPDAVLATVQVES